MSASSPTSSSATSPPASPPSSSSFSSPQKQVQVQQQHEQQKRKNIAVWVGRPNPHLSELKARGIDLRFFTNIAIADTFITNHLKESSCGGGNNNNSNQQVYVFVAETRAAMEYVLEKKKTLFTPNRIQVCALITPWSAAEMTPDLIQATHQEFDHELDCRSFGGGSYAHQMTGIVYKLLLQQSSSSSERKVAVPPGLPKNATFLGSSPLGNVWSYMDYKTKTKCVARECAKERLDERSIEQYRRRAKFNPKFVIPAKPITRPFNGLVCSEKYEKHLEMCFKNEPLPLCLFYRCVHSCLNAMKEIHRHNCILRGLSPLIICYDYNNNIRIESSFVVPLDDANLWPDMLLPRFTAPEGLVTKRFSFASDVWSLGCCCTRLLTGRQPFDDDNTRNTEMTVDELVEFFSKLMQKGEEYTPELPAHVPQKTRALVHQMLRMNPADRVTVDELLANPLFQEESWNSEDPSLDLASYYKFPVVHGSSKFHRLEELLMRSQRKCRVKANGFTLVEALEVANKNMKSRIVRNAPPLICRNKSSSSSLSSSSPQQAMSRAGSDVGGGANGVANTTTTRQDHHHLDPATNQPAAAPSSPPVLQHVGGDRMRPVDKARTKTIHWNNKGGAENKEGNDDDNDDDDTADTGGVVAQQQQQQQKDGAVETNQYPRGGRGRGNSRSRRGAGRGGGGSRQQQQQQQQQPNQMNNGDDDDDAANVHRAKPQADRRTNNNKPASSSGGGDGGHNDDTNEALVAFVGVDDRQVEMVLRHGVLPAGHRLNTHETPPIGSGTIGSMKRGAYLWRFPISAARAKKKDELKEGDIIEIIMFDIVSGYAMKEFDGTQQFTSEMYDAADIWASRDEYFLLPHVLMQPKYILRIKVQKSFMSMFLNGPRRFVVLPKVLGTGGFGRVYQALQMPEHRPCACKTFHLSDSDSIDACRTEFEAMKAVKTYAHVAQVIGWEMHEGMAFLFMELMSCSLADLVEATGAPLPEPQVLKYFFEAACGLESLALEGMTHCDLKPGNLMLSGDGTLKLVDFGLAIAMGSHTLGFTPAFVAPEIVSARKEGRAIPYTAAADIYSLGVTMWCLLKGKKALSIPFDENFVDVRQRTLFEQMPATDNISPQLRSTLVQCLSVDPSLRPTLQDLTQIELYSRSMEALMDAERNHGGHFANSNSNSDDSTMGTMRTVTFCASGSFDRSSTGGGGSSNSGGVSLPAQTVTMGSFSFPTSVMEHMLRHRSSVGGSL